MPRSGDLLFVGRLASVQFAADRGFPARVIRVLDWPSDIGYVWLDLYQLNPAGDAVERRSVYVRIDGLQALPTVGRSEPPARPAGNRSTVAPRQTGGSGHNPPRRPVPAPGPDRWRSGR